MRALGGGALCIVLTAGAIWITRESSSSRITQTSVTQQRVELTAENARPLEKPSRRPQSIHRRSEAAAPEQSAAPPDAAAIHALLAKIELDANGAPVIDKRTLAVLRVGFSALPAEISKAQLRELHASIAARLPGAAGEEAAKLVDAYYRYNQALQDLEASAEPAASADAAQARNQQLAVLRQLHFGSETAAKLFAEEQAFESFTIESIRIQEQASLAQNDKDRWQAQLREQLPAGVLPDKPSTNELQWQERFAQFDHERSLVLKAGLSQRDQQEQIERLLTTYFKPHEMDRARRYVATYEGDR